MIDAMTRILAYAAPPPKTIFQLSSTQFWQPNGQRASEEEYRAYLHEHTNSPSYRVKMLSLRKRFVKTYPALLDWYQAPLPQRVGRLYGEDGEKTPLASLVSFQARRYLSFLGLRLYTRIDWPWLLAHHHLDLNSQTFFAPLKTEIDQLTTEGRAIGYSANSCRTSLNWFISRLALHHGLHSVNEITKGHLLEFEDALARFCERPDLALYGGPNAEENLYSLQHDLYLLELFLYQRGQLAESPSQRSPRRTIYPVLQPKMQAVVLRYLRERSLRSSNNTLLHFNIALQHFMRWLKTAHPELESFAQVTRDHLVEYREALNSMVGAKTGRPLTDNGKRGKIGKVMLFFKDVTGRGWEDVPTRILMTSRDLPKETKRLPRYIPEEELGRLMSGIRQLECPYQRTALLVARWSGARRDEIRRLELDCLDRYPDGTARLRIPAGKTKQERMVPLNEEAAIALQTLAKLPQVQQARGLTDPYSGNPVRYLFVHYGRLHSANYLFDTGLRIASEKAGLPLGPSGRSSITSHRFRHTLATQLAERGARLHTIMKILGHESADMAVIYAWIGDREVLEDYQAVLGKGVSLAGFGAVKVREGKFSEPEVDWLKTNFFKTELELGHCLRLPQEGPCECDLYLNCAKFVTTREYTPRLRKRRKVELSLIEDARSQGWMREVERHECSIRRIEQLLGELGEELEGSVETVD